MRTFKIKGISMEVTRIAYGCMGIGGAWDATPLTDQTRKDAMLAVHAALDQGINFFDHADIYGRGKAEEAFSQVWRDRPSLRQSVIVQTKCGIRFENDPVPGVPLRYDYSHDHIMRAVEGSLRRLGTDYVDILLLHRPDALVEPQEVARAFDRLSADGKVRCFGVSNHSAWQIELLKRWVTQRLVVNQLEVNVVHNQLVNAGVSVNQDQPAMPTHGEGTLEYCRLNDITIQAWSPLAHGAFAKQSNERATKTAEVAEALARQKGVSVEAILVGWLLRHPAGIQPVIGTTKPDRIKAACQADSVELTREEWYQLFTAGRGGRVA